MALVALAAWKKKYAFAAFGLRFGNKKRRWWEGREFNFPSKIFPPPLFPNLSKEDISFPIKGENSYGEEKFILFLFFSGAKSGKFDA